MHYNIVRDLVRKTLRDNPLPENFWDLPDRDQRPFLERANRDGVKPEDLYEVVKTQRAEDLKNSADGGFDPAAIARAARSGPFSGQGN